MTSKLTGKSARTLVSILGFGVLVFGGYFYFQVTDEPDLSGLAAPTNFDAKEAKRKQALMDPKRKDVGLGFVTLSEVELNSYLSMKFRATPTKSKAPPNRMVVTRCRLDLSHGEPTLYVWIRRQWLGREWNLVWQRTGELAPKGTQWNFEIHEMRLGNVRVPAWAWPKIEGVLGEADSAFHEEIQWIKTLPAIEFRSSELTRRPEIRLYNYADTNALARFNPADAPTP